MVVQRGVNDHCMIPMAAWARREGLELRYIEYMDVGCPNGWRRAEVFTEQEIRGRVHRVWPLETSESDAPYGTAQRFRYCDGGGEIGIIASITRPFCVDCSRTRVSSVGKFYPCLFATMGVDLASPLRRGEELRRIIATLWQRRNDRYSELRAFMPSSRPRPEMSAIGGLGLTRRVHVERSHGRASSPNPRPPGSHSPSQLTEPDPQGHTRRASSPNPTPRVTQEGVELIEWLYIGSQWLSQLMPT